MARNSEKAQSMLNRWLAYKKSERQGFVQPKERPKSAMECNSIADCEKWRMEFIRELEELILDIQNGKSI